MSCSFFLFCLPLLVVLGYFLFPQLFFILSDYLVYSLPTCSLFPSDYSPISPSVFAASFVRFSFEFFSQEADYYPVSLRSSPVLSCPVETCLVTLPVLCLSSSHLYSVQFCLTPRENHPSLSACYPRFERSAAGRRYHYRPRLLPKGFFKLPADISVLFSITLSAGC